MTPIKFAIKPFICLTVRNCETSMAFQINEKAKLKGKEFFKKNHIKTHKMRKRRKLHCQDAREILLERLMNFTRVS